MNTSFRVWFTLLALTSVEVVLAYMQVSPGWMLLALVGLSTIKAILIAGWFMHLKFERTSLFLALIPTLTVFILLLFSFLPDATRALHMRPQ
jgi:cytochrome c oxidase subunit IV